MRGGDGGDAERAVISVVIAEYFERLIGGRGGVGGGPAGGVGYAFAAENSESVGIGNGCGEIGFAANAAFHSVMLSGVPG